ncbi:GTP cyclohydrolase I [Lentzea sp. JNUCC 0626]|uniref:GTP cyclohydrolase I n=1 Tax=Lentzea sp. JNUCC 0626 TaxID=3367513 RepID=UPI0037496133
MTTTSATIDLDQPVRQRNAFTDGVDAWLAHRGLDPNSQALRGTPMRLFKALNELTAGYDEDPAVLLSARFDVERSDEMIVVTGVPFTSLCEHHLLPFTGTATIAYLPAPGAAVAGLSKLPRVLDAYARRLQVQEQLTRQVTTALDSHLDTDGSACVIRAVHGCLAHRGARKPGSVMVTSSYTGRFQADIDVRGELLAHIHD